LVDFYGFQKPSCSSDFIRLSGTGELKGFPFAERERDIVPMKKPINKIDIFITICIVLLFLFFSLKTYGPFEALERFFYNAEMRLDLPTISLENKIAIVNIDAKSLQQLGPWPWPRHVIGDMIRILKNNGASLIGLNLLLPSRS